MKFFLFISFFYNVSYFSQQAMDSTDFDDFSINSGWDVFDKEKAKAEMVNGSYFLENKKKEGSYTFFKQMDLDYGKDFTFEIALKQIDGEEGQPYGIIWGMKNWNSYNAFFITPTGHYKIAAMVNKNAVVKLPWKKDGLMKFDADNTIMIECKGSEISYYINSVKAYSLPRTDVSISGHLFGIYLSGEKKLKVRYVKTKAIFKKLNKIPNSEKGFAIESLGSFINTLYYNSYPTISPDGSTLYFCTNKNDEKSDEIFYSTLTANGSWNEASPLAMFNNKAANAIVSVSADNNVIYLLHTYNLVGDFNGKGVSLARRIESGWSTPQEVKVDNFYYLNSYPYFSFSQDGKFLLLGIERRDTKGSVDIYVSFKKGDCNYTQPLNLGGIVNTYASETTPFLASDNKTLYFSSIGHKGYGGNDIFVTHRLDETWTNWSEPQNLGPEVNTKNYESYFSVPASGKEAFTVREDSMGKSEIFKIKLSKSAQPKPIALVNGKVLNKKTKTPVAAAIIYFDMLTNDEEGDAFSNPTTGKFNIILQSGKKYAFRAVKQNFFGLSELLDAVSLDENKASQKDLVLIPIDSGSSIPLRNVYFNPKLKRESYNELDYLASVLNNNPKLEIEVGVYASENANEYDSKITQQQAEIVMNYLINKGIGRSRLQSKGYGKAKPKTEIDTEEGKSISNRVEFTILKQ